MMNENSPRLFRVFIPVSDFDAAVAFYRELFGFGGNAIHRGRHYFDCGGVIVAVIENNGQPIADHLYFAVRDLDAFYERAKKLECLEDSDIHGEPAGEMVVRPWRERSFYARDPFGNGLCFVDDTTLFIKA